MKRRKFLGTYGDIDFLTYGGGIVFLNIYGDLTMVNFERNDWDTDFDENRPKWLVHIIHIDDTTLHFVDWKKMTSFTGIDMQSLSNEIMKEDADPINKAMLVRDCAYYYGWSNFDEYPRIMTKTEINRFYGRWVR